MKHDQTTEQRGQAALSLVFLIGGIALIAGTAVALFAISFITAGYGFEATQHLQAATSSGVADGLLQLDRNKSFSSGGYTVSVDTVSATVTVTQNSPASNEATIVSTASLGIRSRTMTAVVNLNPTTGQVTVLSLQ